MRRLSILAIAAAVAASCGGSSGEAATSAPGTTATTSAVATTAVVSSSDGAATLSIPPGALPAGVSAADITVTEVAGDPSLFDLEGGPVLAAYRIEPAGLQLTEPAVLSFPTQAFDTPVVLLHLSGEDYGTVEVIPGDAVDFDDSTDPPMAHVEVSHFSLLTELPAAFFDVTVEHEGTYIVGDVVQATVTVAGNGFVWSSGLSGDWGYSQLTFTVHDEFWVEGTVYGYGALDPSMVEDIPPGAWVDGIYQATVAFDCEEPGDFTVRNHVYITATYHGAQTRSGYPAEEWDTTATNTREYSGEKDGECVAATAPSATAGSVGSGLTLNPDDLDDLIDSIMERLTSFTAPWIDLTGTGAEVITITPEMAQAWFNDSLYECATESEEGQFVVCPDAVEAMPAGDLLVGVAQVSADIPLRDATHSYIYSMVFDSDGDPANDWVIWPPYDGDYFQGTDRWYQLTWDHRAGTWSVTVNEVDITQQVAKAPSAARALIDGDRVIWLIPMSEFAIPNPGYRFSTFGHDGFYGESDRGGDVNGTDATEPLTTLP